MQIEDYIEVARHINILNVAYHLCLEITDDNPTEYPSSTTTTTTIFVVCSI